MPYTKPTINPDTVLTLLQQQFTESVSQLEPVSIGHISQTYSFVAGEQSYIIRFNATSEFFEKDAYAYKHYASPDIPIPPIVTIGRRGEVAYAISEKIPGTMLNFMDDATYRQVIPSVLEVLDAIHHIDVSQQQHYGYINSSGVGNSNSWRQYLQSLSLVDLENETNFSRYWQTLFQESMLEQSVFENVYQKMLSLLDYCPEERYLVHGDYGFDNVLASQGKITAVLDWASSLYGDFLYDAAYLHFFSYQYDFLELIRKFYASKHRSLPFYDERMLCYTCFISLNVLKFFASAQLQREYIWARDRIVSLLDSPPQQMSNPL